MNNVQNSVTLIGNLGQDATTFETKKGGKVTRLRLATNEVYRNKAGEKVNTTYWHNCVAFGKLAENLENLGKKGRKMAVQGKITYNQYKDKQGVDRLSTEIVINDYIALDKQQETN